MKESPTVLISRPWKRASSFRPDVMLVEAPASGDHPNPLTAWVAPTMSVKSTVASTRSASRAGLIQSKFLDFVDNHVPFLRPPGMIHARHFDKARTRNVFGEKAAFGELHITIPGCGA